MTRLKALEIHGFKSFADRTRFEFHSGVTAIVGPNGSGKSNVVDAIKWVLGEQSVRSLRGKEMTDVIFAGAAGRRPMNSAETTLIFDNTARELSLAADEVRIGRRVYRSGESEYLINGEVSRLRDIRELFSGTGAATEAYSVIEQGRVDKLLVASGKERRGVFEEAAGITKFRTRRAEALRRLERAEQNRQRLADIVGEVASRLETVLRQAARAKRWRVLSDRLKQCRLAAAAHDLAGVDAELIRLEQERTRLAQGCDRARESLAAFDARVQELSGRVESLDLELEASEERVAEARQKVAAADASLHQLDTRRHEVANDLAQAAARVAQKVREDRAAAESEKVAADAVAEGQAEFEQLDSQLAQLRTTAEGSLASADAAREACSRLQDAVAASQRQHLAKRMEQERLASLAATADQKAQECRRRAEQNAAAKARLAESLAASDGNLASLESRLRGELAEVEALEQQEADLSSTIRTTWDELAQLRSQLEACRERERVLAELSQQHDGVPAGVQSLLRGELPSPSGLAGMLADAIRADASIAPLVDLALGHLGPSLVIDSLDDAISWAQKHAHGDGNRCGPLSFLALSPPPAPTRIKVDLSNMPGVVGRLDQFVSSDERYQPLVTRVLGTFWVVESLDDAQRLHPDAGPENALVTRDGLLLSARGSVEVGGKSMAGLVARHSEQSSLEERHRNLTASVEQHEQTLARHEHERTRLREAARSLRSRQEHTQGELATSRAERQRLLRDQAASITEIERAEEARRVADREAVEIRHQHEQMADEVTAAASDEQSLIEDLAAARKTIETFDRSRGSLLDEIHESTRALEHARARLTESRDELRRLEAVRNAGRAACGEEHARLCDVERRRSLLDLECLRIRQTHAEAAIDVEHAVHARRSLQRQRERCLADAREATAGSRIAQEGLTELERQGHTTDLAFGEARHTRARIVERIREDYDLDIDASDNAALPGATSSAPDEDPIPDSRDALEGEIDELRRKISAFSSVNLEALTEAEELEKRHAELEAQLTDVTQAKASIEQLITRIDEESRRLLGETIETVRGYFRELFERLFAGGQADIVIDPNDDLLDASVEIVARPPGKEPRNISLLSGGEKTMTCVALLLAIFKSRPSPFCVLDEVDAPLDEANVDRFTAVLRESLSSTQFVVVTHSKKTMSAATTLYGITMEQSGVSKRVSVRFEDAVAANSRAA
jgi:chromosome segregation protein